MNVRNLINLLGWAIVLSSLALLNGCASHVPSESVSLVQSKRGAAIAISDKLLFDVGKANLQPTANDALDKIAVLLNSENNRTVVFVEGHTDNRGGREINNRLSVARANAVRQALIDRSVNPSKMEAKGFGFEEPIESNDTEEGRARNRRVEVVFPNESLDNLKKLSEKFKGLF